MLGHDLIKFRVFSMFANIVCTSTYTGCSVHESVKSINFNIARITPCGRRSIPTASLLQIVTVVCSAIAKLLVQILK